MKKANYCFVCSKTNPKGLHITFERIENMTFAKFVLEKEYEGYPGIVHGGILAAILDDAMGNIKYLEEYIAYTVEMSTRYINPSFTGEELQVRAWLESAQHKIVKAIEDIRDKKGVIKVRAKAKYYIGGKIKE